MDVNGKYPSYLKNENLEETNRRDEVRALMKLRCSNLEMANKYWIEKDNGGVYFAKRKKIV